MLRVKNEKDLLNILRVISSEAVGLSKKKFMNENADPTLDRYQKQLQKDEKMYGSLDEQEKEETEEEAEEKLKRNSMTGYGWLLPLIYGGIAIGRTWN